MTAIVMSYTVNPLVKFYKGMKKTFEIVGYSRAAAELARMGLHEESKNCMMQIAKLRD